LENAAAFATESPVLIGAGLCATSCLLFCAARAPAGVKTSENASFFSALEVGLLQLAAVFPGVSRSGATFCSGVLCGYDADFALDFAFLLSLPAVAGAAVFKLPALFASGEAAKMLLPCAAGFAASALAGFAAIKTLRLLVRKNGFWIFGIYCALSGAAVIITSLIRG
jgi:undecaprenyl-diphosphatase